MSEQQVSPSEPRGRGAGLFDLRWILALLFAVFGLVVTLAGVFAKAKTYSASGTDIGVNVNVWSGVGMLILAALFALWAQLRPVRLPVSKDE